MSQEPKQNKIRILFVCHGNICRSPMAEFLLKQMVEQSGRSNEFEIESAAVSSEELGNPVYGPVKRLLAHLGIDCAGKTARRIQKADYDHFDHIIGMDAANLTAMRRAFGGDPAGKLSLLMDFTARPGNVADPWYTRDFEATYRDVREGCRGLLERF